MFVYNVHGSHFKLKLRFIKKNYHYISRWSLIHMEQNVKCSLFCAFHCMYNLHQAFSSYFKPWASSLLHYIMLLHKNLKKKKFQQVFFIVI